MLIQIFNILLFIVLLYVLRALAKKYVSFGKRVMLALFLGIGYGFYLNYTYIPLELLNTVGNSYVALLKMISMPLIMVSILSSIVNLKDSKEATETGSTVVFTLLSTAAIASIVSIIVTLAFKLDARTLVFGSREAARGEKILQLAEKTTTTISEKIVSFIPTNPFLDMTGARSTSIIAIVIFSAFVGFAILGIKKKKQESAKLVIDLINAISDVVLRLVTIVLRLTPYGVLALMSKVVATTDYKSLINLINFVGASYVSIAIMFIIHLIIVTLFGLSPIVYFKKAIPTLIFAFTSRSSAGTIPLTIESQKNMGVESGVANVAATFGTSIGQNGCAAIYPTMLAIMIAPIMGVNPSDIVFLAKLVVIVTISSLGVAGIGGGATFAAIIVLSTLGFDIRLVGLLISVEPLIDMARTALNVNGSIVAGLVSSRILKKHDKEKYYDKTV